MEKLLQLFRHSRRHCYCYQDFFLSNLLTINLNSSLPHTHNRNGNCKILMDMFQLSDNSQIMPEVSESHFFNLETRMRISPIQSRTLRRDREFLTLNLRLRVESENKSPPISGIETRLRFIIFILRLRDENENSLDLISVFETRTRILKVAIFP